MTSELRKIYSQRGNVLILKDGFKFSKYGELQTGEIGWKCVEKSCRAKLYTIGGNNCKLSRETGTHVHLPLDENIIMRQAISNRLKRKSAQYLTEKPSRLVEIELNNEQNEAFKKLTTNDIKLIKDNMYHARARKKQILVKKHAQVSTEDLIEYTNNIENDQTYFDKEYHEENTTFPEDIPKTSCRIKVPKDLLTQENKYEEFPDWICIEPHFLATDLY